MWYWGDPIAAGWWWLLPLTAALCFLFMFLFMRRFFMTRFAWCGTAPISVTAADPEKEGAVKRTLNRFAESVSGM